MKVAIYARESTSDTNKAPPIEEQIKRARAYIKENGYTLIQEYQDNGYSGGNRNRPAFNQIIKDAKRHLFQLVIVWNQDRIARDTEQFLWFYRNLKEAHTSLHSLTEGKIELERLGDRVKHTSLAQASEIFRLVTSEKVKGAYKSKKAKEGDNMKWGRPKGKYDLDKIIKLRESGWSYRKIGNEMNCSYQTIRRLLQNTPQDFTSKNTLN